MSRTSSVAVIGGGWAGCAAALELARAGHQVTLYEAQRTLGGRARALQLGGHTLDNGQHIMLGAYAETLRVMHMVGVSPRKAFLRLPLQIRYPEGGTGMTFAAPRLPAPFHLVWALLRAKGLDREDKLALARFSTSARWMGWTLDQDCTVSALLDRFEQTGRLVQLLWRPLCLAALNTPPDQASARVFLQVLGDSLGARRAASDMLLPRTDLSEAFPAAAARYIGRRGGTVVTGAKVESVNRDGDAWQLVVSGSSVGGVLHAPADAVVLATSAHAAAGLAAPLPGLDALAQQLDSFAYEPITTCYLQYEPGLRLARPFHALQDDAATGHFGQFVFDRGQLEPAHAGLLAVVASASGSAAALEQDLLAQAIAIQLSEAFGMPALAAPAWARVITEKRATFACVAGLSRPPNETALPGLVLAGDYTESKYPATLESAVRSGVQAARLLARRR